MLFPTTFSHVGDALVVNPEGHAKTISEIFFLRDEVCTVIKGN